MRAPAKINLGLEILKKRPDGYHDLKTIFCQVSLYDTIIIDELTENKIQIDCDYPGVPIDEKNTIYKAAFFLKEKSGVKKGVVINIEKKIPIEAGLGGGSSDAAAALLGLNRLWKLNLDLDELISIGLKIGADVPYPVVGGTKFATGVGEVFENLPSAAGMNLVICVPDFGVSTKWAFEHVDYKMMGKGKINALIKAIKKRDKEAIATNLHNDLEYWVFKRCPIIAEIKERLLGYGALGAVMTGTGSGVFGIYRNRERAKEIYKRLKKDFKKTFLVKTI